MSTVLVPRTMPAPPADEATAVGVPVRADTEQAITDGVLHDVLVAHRVVDQRQMVRLLADEPIDASTPFGTAETHRIRFQSSPWGTHVGCLIHYQTSGVTTAGRTVTAELYDSSGVQLDPGCEWSVEEGTLDITSEGRGGGRRFTVALAQTPDGRTDDGAVALTPPRLLTIPDADKGSKLELRLTTADVRVVAVSTYEAVRPTVEQ